jgi:ankyrin repeat protein
MYETPLYLAALEGKDEAVSLLLDNGAIVGAVNGHMQSPLHAAAFGGHVAVASYLLERGADPLLKDEVCMLRGLRWRAQRHCVA